MTMALRSLLKEIIVRALSLVPARLSALSILMYHSVSDSSAFFSVAPKEFERQMRYIHDSGLTTVFSSEISQCMTNGKLANTVCSSDLDGYEDVYKHAFPVFKQFGIKATVFLITSEIGGSYTNSEGSTFPLLSERQIAEMQGSGLVEFMPHGHTHKKLHQLPEGEQRNEIQLSSDIVERLTGSKPRVFAHPRGRTTPAIGALLKEYGYALALGVVPGLVRPDSDPYNIPRNAVDKNVGFAEFKLKLSDNLERYLSLVRIFSV